MVSRDAPSRSEAAAGRSGGRGEHRPEGGDPMTEVAVGEEAPANGLAAGQCFLERLPGVVEQAGAPVLDLILTTTAAWR